MNPYLYMILVGAVAGFLAGLILKGGGFGLIGNIIVGIIGAVVGGWLFGMLGIGSIGTGFVAAVIPALAGSIVCLLLVGLLKKKR